MNRTAEQQRQYRRDWAASQKAPRPEAVIREDLRQQLTEMLAAANQRMRGPAE